MILGEILTAIPSIIDEFMTSADLSKSEEPPVVLLLQYMLENSVELTPAGKELGKDMEKELYRSLALLFLDFSLKAWVEHLMSELAGEQVTTAPKLNSLGIQSSLEWSN